MAKRPKRPRTNAGAVVMAYRYVAKVLRFMRRHGRIPSWASDRVRDEVLRFVYGHRPPVIYITFPKGRRRR